MLVSQLQIWQEVWGLGGRTHEELTCTVGADSTPQESLCQMLFLSGSVQNVAGAGPLGSWTPGPAGHLGKPTLGLISGVAQG